MCRPFRYREPSEKETFDQRRYRNPSLAAACVCLCAVVRTRELDYPVG